MSITIPSISTEPIEVTATYNVDPTSLPVQFAFMGTGEPSSGDWKSGSWDGAATAVGDRYRATATIRIGPGATVTLTDGDYDGWIRVVDDTPDGPTRKFDRIRIT